MKKTFLPFIFFFTYLFFTIPSASAAALSESCSAIWCGAASDWYAGACRPTIDTIDDCGGEGWAFSCDQGCYECDVDQVQKWDGTGWVCSDSSAGLWSQNGTDIYYNSGNVGIGTDTPLSALQINMEDGSAILATGSEGGIVGFGNDFGVSGYDQDDVSHGTLGAGPYGVYGSGNYGLYGDGHYYGVYGIVNNTDVASSSPVYGVYGIASTAGTGTAYAGYFNGLTYSLGDILTNDDLGVQDYGYFYGGVHIGSSSDPGTDNLIVDGTSALTGAVTLGSILDCSQGLSTDASGKITCAATGDGSGGGGGGGGTVIYKKCPWRDANYNDGSGPGSCTPDPCPSGWTDLGVGSVISALGSSAYNGGGYFQRACYSDSSYVVYSVVCPFYDANYSDGSGIGSCTPNACSSGWTDFGVNDVLLDTDDTTLSTVGYSERICAIASAGAGGADTDWTETASYVYNNSGKNIGIGTDIPSYNLTVTGDTYTSADLLAGDDLGVQDYGYFYGGVHIGSSSDPGTDNLIVDGTSALTGAVTLGSILGCSQGLSTDASGKITCAATGDGSGGGGEAGSSGLTWVLRSPTSSGSWNNVTYGNGLFVAVGDYKVMTSPDGIDWTERSVPYPDWNDITYGNGLFVAVGDYGALSSSDGVNWTRVSLGYDWDAVTYGNGLFVAVSQSDTWLATSSDGVNWQTKSVPTWDDIIYANGLFVAVRSGATLTSSDGVNWTQHNISAFGGDSITYGNGLFVATTAIGGINTSSDGITWTTEFSSTESIRDIVYGDNLFVATGNITLTSSDGHNWTINPSAPASYPNKITYGNGTFVAISTTGTYIMTSDSAISSGGTTGVADTDWTETASYVYNNSGKKVGIGTATPQSALSVGGDGDAAIRIGQDPQLILSRNDTSSMFRIEVGGSGYTAYPIQIGRTDGNNEVHIPGKVLIGTATPSYNLTVTGDTYTSTDLLAGDDLGVQDYGYFYGGVHIGGNSDPGTDNLIVDGDVTLGSTLNCSQGLSTNASGVVSCNASGDPSNSYSVFNTLSGGSTSASTTGGELNFWGGAGINVYIGTKSALDSTPVVRFSTSSSRRFKEDIKDSDLGLDEVMQMRPITFRYKPEFGDGGKKFHAGFIAEEMDKISPVLTDYEDDSDIPRSVEYMNITAVLAKAIQEQQGMIEKLQGIVCADHPEADVCR